MSRFADPRVTRRVELGPCECPGTPHGSDFASIRGELSSVEVTRVASADVTDEAGLASLLAEFVVGWNLLDPDGRTIEPTADALRDLMAPTLKAIVDGIGDVMRSSAGLVPNASSAPSAASPLGSASRTPSKTRKPGT